MRDLAAWRERRKAELVAEGNAARDRGDIETAGALWSEAYDVGRGHADPQTEEEWRAPRHQRPAGPGGQVMKHHKCDERCVCPVDHRRLYYAPATGEHACENPDCVNAHGYPPPSLLGTGYPQGWLGQWKGKS